MQANVLPMMGSALSFEPRYSSRCFSKPVAGVHQAGVLGEGESREGRRSRILLSCEMTMPSNLSVTQHTKSDSMRFEKRLKRRRSARWSRWVSLLLVSCSPY